MRDRLELAAERGFLFVLLFCCALFGALESEDMPAAGFRDWRDDS